MASNQAERDTQRRLADLEDWRRRHAPHELGPTVGEFYASYQGLPGLRGLWYPGSADNAGAVYDASGQGRTLTLNGNPVISLAAYPTPPILLPYFDLDGTGDFHSRADEAGLEVSGAETYIATVSRGLTVGGWFQADALGALDGFITKYNTTGNQRAYAIDTDGVSARFTVSVDGTATHTATSAAISTGRWMFLVGRFDPSVATEIFVNDVKASNTTAPPATVFSTGTANLEIGRRSVAGTELDGRWALTFLCAARLPDFYLTYLYRRGNILFGL